MPCRDWDENTRYVEVDRPSTVDKLCDAYRTLIKHNIPLPSKEAKIWWAAHVKEDEAKQEAIRKKLLREKKREFILNKLTQEERKILGL